MKWTEEQTINFVTEYVKHECLYNTNSADYKNKQSRQNALLKISRILNIADFGPKEVYLKIRSLKSTYSQELKKIRNSERSSAATSDIYTPNIKWFYILNYALMSANNTKECKETTDSLGCQFREHAPDERLPTDAAAMELYTRFRDIISMRPPHLVFPERLTRLVAREPGEEAGGRLQCKEVFWWEGMVLVPPRQPLGLLGKLYTSNNKFNPNARPGSPALTVVRSSAQSLAGNSTVTCSSPLPKPELKPVKPTSAKEESPRNKPGGGGGGGGEAAEEASESDESEQSSDSGRSDEDVPRRQRPRAHAPAPPSDRNTRRSVSRACGRVCGRVWVASLSARSNQDGQRRFEERAAAHMRAALARRLQYAPKTNHHPGGVYAKLEAEWRERHAPRQRNAPSARARPGARYK